jgi:hypothetical protein
MGEEEQKRKEKKRGGAGNQIYFRNISIFSKSNSVI